jgi:hypothetical protein
MEYRGIEYSVVQGIGRTCGNGPRRLRTWRSPAKRTANRWRWSKPGRRLIGRSLRKRRGLSRCLDAGIDAAAGTISHLPNRRAGVPSSDAVDGCGAAALVRRCCRRGTRSPVGCRRFTNCKLLILLAFSGSGRGTRTPDPRIMIPDFLGLSAFQVRLPSIFLAIQPLFRS